MAVNALRRSPRPRRGPSNRSRFVLRARTLQTERRFLDRCAEVRTSWNARHPSYAIQELGPCPDPRTVETAAYFPMPPRLLAALKRLQLVDDEEILKRDSLAGRDHAAIKEWLEVIRSICREFWPIDDFPHSMESVGHPARQFVGFCLLHDPRTVPEETILSHRMRPIWLPFDSQRPQDHPLVKAKDAELVALRAALRRALESGDVLGPSDIQRVLVQAAAEAIPACLSALAALDYDPSAGTWCMPIPPDITSSDWRDAEESALRIDGRQPGDFVRDRVVYYRDRGESGRAIARRLGITLRTVSRHLDTAGH